MTNRPKAVYTLNYMWTVHHYLYSGIIADPMEFAAVTVVPTNALFSLTVHSKYFHYGDMTEFSKIIVL